jgi:hypothetical protein
MEEAEEDNKNTEVEPDQIIEETVAVGAAGEK